MIRNVLLFAVSTLLVLGCERDGDRPDVATPDVDDAVQASLFDRIDANSVYVAANLEPVPEPLSNKLWSALEPMMAANQETYETLSEEVEAPLARALLKEFLEIDSRAAFEQRGLHGNGLWAIHGLSLYPVIHWQLLDAAAFNNMLERIATDAGTELPWRSIDDEQVLWVDLDGFGLAIHNDEHFVTAAIVPDDTIMLRRVANLDHPTDTFAPQRLSSFNQDRGYTSQGSGFLDFGRLIERLLDEEDPFVMAGRDAAGVQSIVDDPACQRELRALANTFPRLSSGYTEVANNLMSARITLETDPGMGEKLAGIAEAPFSLDGERSGLLSVGLAFNMIAARDFGREIVAGWVDNPPECQLFSGIAENAEEWQLGLNRPIPPLVTNLHGFKLNFDRLVMGEPSGFGPAVDDASGTLTVFMRNPQMLIGMSQMFSPELAELDLRPGGDPQPLPQGMVPNMPNLAAFIAMGDNAIGLAVGEDQKDKLTATLDPGEADSAVMRYGMDVAAYGEMMETMMAGARQQLAEMDEEIDMPPSEDIFAAMAEVYEYSEMSLHLTPQGIEINSSIILSD